MILSSIVTVSDSRSLWPVLADTFIVCSWKRIRAYCLRAAISTTGATWVVTRGLIHAHINPQGQF